MDNVGSTRRLLVASLVAVSLVVWLWLLQLLAEIGAVRDRLYETALTQARGSFLSGIVLHQLGFFTQPGYLGRLADGSARAKVSFAVATLVVLVVAALVVWLVTSGARGGAAGAVTVFFTAWAAALPVCALAGLASVLVSVAGSAGAHDYLWILLGNGLARGAGSAAWWGWLPALLGALAWLLGTGTHTPSDEGALRRSAAGRADGPRLQKP